MPTRRSNRSSIAARDRVRRAPPATTSTPAAITFAVAGAVDVAAGAGATRSRAASADTALPAGLARGQLLHRLQLAAARGGAARSTPQRVQATPGRDVVVLRIEGGPALVLHPEHARDLLRAQQPPGTRGAAPGAAADEDEVTVPAQLQWQGQAGAEGARSGGTRGLLGNVLLAGLDIVRDADGTSLADVAADKSALLVARRVDDQVRAGVYALDAQGLPRLKDSGAAALAALPAAAGPLLVFIHGTFSNTSSAFGKLWQQHPQRVAALFEHYEGRVYALEHATLTQSPLANALTLAQALPDGACLHLVTHSRGGLVAEALARAAAMPAPPAGDLRAFTTDEQRDLKALSALLARKQVRIERIVRVACPARGTLLASKRLDAYLSVFKWTLELAGVPVLPELVEFLSAVAQRRADPMLLPGLAAQVPDSALIRWLHAGSAALPGQLRVIAGDVQGDSVGSWLKTLLADGFYWTDNDFIVQTRSMYGGAPREGGALFLLDRGAGVAHTAYFGAEHTAQALCSALVDDAPAQFSAIGAQSWAGESASGARAASAPAGNAWHLPWPALPAGRSTTVAAATTATPRSQGPAAAGATACLDIEIVNGNLKYVRAPLMLGHYRASNLTGTEWVVDSLIGRAMSQALAAGLYPDAPGSHQIFINAAVPLDNPLQMPRPHAAIVVGLGEEGTLRADDLSRTVCQAVLAWAQRLAEAGDAPARGFELAATLVASGGAGISAGQAAQLIARGARDAKLRLRSSRWPQLQRLVLVELYLDRASEAWRALQVLRTASPGHYSVVETIRSGQGALRRGLDAGYRGADYDLLAAVHRPYGDSDATIEYTIDTKRARSEVRAQATQGKLLRELIRRASNEWQRDGQIGKTLHQLLIPPEMDPFFGGSTEMRIELDERTAGIPWELLDTASRGGGGDGQPPWAIRSKLLRKLRTVEFRADVTGAADDARVLVVGEPDCDRACYGSLPHARAEALALRHALREALGADAVRGLISGEGPVDAQTVINTLLEQDWRIVHIAGHGEPPDDAEAPGARDPRGVVLSDGTFLGPREIRNMRTVPELVFVNCCHLAVRDAKTPGTAAAAARAYDRVLFASSVAEALIRIGVRCVIAAGWAVDDEPARIFATTFYAQLLDGERFIDAVAAARAAAWQCGGNTWAAYQCYGDPDWFFRREGAQAKTHARPLEDEFAGVSSPLALTLALETVAVTSREGLGRGAAQERARLKKQAERIRHLEERFAPRWGGMGAVAEAFATAWAACGHEDEAIGWYRRAVRCNDASASIKAQEQLAALTARQAWTTAMSAAPASQAFGKARAELECTVAALRSLAQWQPTVERCSLVGSALKQLGMVEQRAGHADEARSAFTAALEAYRHAHTLARDAGDSAQFYPGLNCMALQLVSALSAGARVRFDAAATAALRRCLEQINGADTDVDFWSIVGAIEVDLYEAIGAGQLAPQLEALADAYERLYQRVSSPPAWDSVAHHTAFVLDAYGRVARGDEARAVASLKARLRKFADE